MSASAPTSPVMKHEADQSLRLPPLRTKVTLPSFDTLRKQLQLDLPPPPPPLSGPSHRHQQHQFYEHEYEHEYGHEYEYEYSHGHGQPHHRAQSWGSRSMPTSPVMKRESLPMPMPLQPSALLFQDMGGAAGRPGSPAPMHGHHH
nr:hypothetical protein HK105_003833 [Polyrhizophydium stewartii]